MRSAASVRTFCAFGYKTEKKKAFGRELKLESNRQRDELDLVIISLIEEEQEEERETEGEPSVQKEIQGEKSNRK